MKNQALFPAYLATTVFHFPLGFNQRMLLPRSLFSAITATAAATAAIYTIRVNDLPSLFLM